MSTTQIHITLEQLNEWAIENGRQPSTKYKNVQYFLNTMEVVPPKQLMKQLRSLVVDEAVSPEDLVIWVSDKHGEQYTYNIRLSEIFKLVYTPVNIDKSIIKDLL